MGYCMEMMEQKFRILKKKQALALKAIKDLAGKETIIDMTGKHYSWVDTKNFVNARHVEDALRAWRWEVDFDDLNNINGIAFRGEKLGDEEILFKAIAPFVEAGSYIQMQGEDGSIWRWSFNGKTVREVTAHPSFEEV